MHEEHQVPIWFFIGCLLLIYGLIITATGIYLWICPPEHQVELFQYHADVWWGCLLVVLGLFYSIRFNPWGKGETIYGRE
jgi:FtsH-binding integral membrane protein